MLSRVVEISSVILWHIMSTERIQLSVITRGVKALPSVLQCERYQINWYRGKGTILVDMQICAVDIVGVYTALITICITAPLALSNTQFNFFSFCPEMNNLNNPREESITSEK